MDVHLRHADVSCIHGHAETLQEIVLQANRNGRSHRRVQYVSQSILVQVVIVVTDVYRAARGEAFLIRAGVDSLPLNQNRIHAPDRVRLRQRAMAEGGGFLNRGIVCLRDGADLRYRHVRSAGRAAVVASGYPCSRLAAEHALAARNRRCLGCAGGNAWQCSAGLGALEAPSARIVPARFDIDIVLERQCNRILCRQVKLARANKTLEAP